MSISDKYILTETNSVKNIKLSTHMNTWITDKIHKQKIQYMQF